MPVFSFIISNSDHELTKIKISYLAIVVGQQVEQKNI